MVSLVLFIALVGSAACSRPPTLLVTVNGVPPGASSLAAFIVKQDAGGQLVGSQSDLQPYDLAAPAPSQVSFVLRMPDAMAADLTVSAAVFSQPQALGCVLSSGSAVHSFQPALLDDSVTIDLDAVAMDAGCQGSPRIISAGPAQLHAKGGDTLTVAGWGFRPGSTLTLDGVPLVTTYRSAAVLEAVVPAALHMGLVPLTLTVPGQTAAMYSGLRYVVDNVAFMPGGMQPSTALLRGVHVLDLDGDGSPDLSSLPISQAGTDITVLFQRQPLTFTQKTITVAAKLVDLATVDVDKDGDIDLITASAMDNTLRLLRNDGAGGLTIESQALTFTPYALAAGDISGDGAPDVLILNDAQTMLYTLLNDGKGHFGTPTATSISKVVQPTQITIMDFNLDGKLDVILDSEDFGAQVYQLGVLLNQGTGLAASDAGVMFLPLPDFFDGPLVNRDIDGDGKADLLVSVTSESYHLYLSGSQPPRVEQKVSPPCGSVLVAGAELTGDGRGDLLLTCAGMPGVSFMLQTATGGFATGAQAPMVATPNIAMLTVIDVQAVDLDGDRMPELLVGSDHGYFIYKNLSR